MARKKVSQEKVGEALGLTQASVSARLGGKIPFDINELVKIAALLEVSVETLIDGIAA